MLILLTDKNLTIATAESCTGGKIAATLSAVPGASNYFKGSVVSYATQAKTNVLGVANELIIEVLLRKSDTLTGATRNHLESLKNYLEEKKQTTFTNAEIRRNLRVKETTLRRYNKQLLAEDYIKKTKGKKGQLYHFEIVNVDEYKELKTLIKNALDNCIAQINLATSS